MSEIIFAPFTEEQVINLNKFQKNPRFHPFTCGVNRKDPKHLDGEGVLIATKKGWICPYCSYLQDWAISWMAEEGNGLSTT